MQFLLKGLLVFSAFTSFKGAIAHADYALLASNSRVNSAVSTAARATASIDIPAIADNDKSSFDHLSVFASNYDHEAMAGHRVFSTSTDNANRTLIATSNGVYLYQNAKKLKAIFLPQNITPYTSIQFEKDRWWAINQNKLVSIAARDFSYQEYTPCESQACRLLELELIDGKVWLGHDRGIAVLDPNQGIVQHLPRAQTAVYDIKPQIQNGELFRVLIGTNRGLFTLPLNPQNAEESVWKHLNQETAEGWSKALIVYEITLTQKSQSISELWLSTSEGLLQFNPNNNAIVAKYFDGQAIVNAFAYSTTELWLMTTAGGVLRFDTESRSATPLSFVDEKRHPYSNLVIDSIERDLFGSLWLSSQSSGLFKINPYQQHLRYASTLQAHESHRTYAVLATQNQGLWAAVDGGGINQYDKFWRKQANLLAGETAYALTQDANKRIWIGGTKGVKVWEPKSQQMIDSLPPQLENTVAQSFHLDSQQRMWIGAIGGVAFFDGQKARLINSPEQGLDGKFFNDVIEDLAKTIWVGGQKGLFRWRESQQNFIAVDGLRDKWVTHLSTIDSKLLVSTRSGFYVYDSKTEKLERHFSQRFEGEVMASFWYQGALVVVTRQDIHIGQSRELKGERGFEAAKFFERSDSLNWQTLSKQTGLLSQFFNMGAIEWASMQTGETLVLGSEQGVTVLAVDKLLASINREAIDFKASIVALQSQSLSMGHNNVVKAPFALPYKHDALRLELSSNDTRFDGGQYFRFRFNGENWQSWQESSQLTFAKLAAGDYLLEVQARNALGRVSQVDHLRFGVAVPWWLTPTAYAIYAIGFIFLNLLIYTLRLRYIQNRNRWLEQEVNLKTSELQASSLQLKGKNEQLEQQSRELANKNRQVAKQATELEKLLENKELFFRHVTHELKTPITLMLGPIEILQQKIGEEQTRRLLAMAYDNGTRLLDAVNQLLDFERFQNLGVDKTVRTHASDSVLQTVQRLESLLQKKSQILVTHIEDNLHVTLEAFALEKIVENLLSNASKYAPENTEVQLLLKAKGDALILEVIDAGPGVPPDMQAKIFEHFSRMPEHKGITGSGIGLAIVKTIVDNLGGGIRVTNLKPTGAHFLVELPNVILDRLPFV